MNTFIEIICEGTMDSFNLLVISGEPAETDLIAAWHDIVERYTEKVASPEQKIYVSVYKSVIIQQMTLQQVAVILEAMRDKLIYAPELADELNRLLNSSFQFDPENDMDGYFATLKAAETRSKGILLDLRIKEATLKAMQDKQSRKKDEAPDRDYFVKIKVTLEEVYQIPQFNYDTLSVSEYCERLIRAVQKSKS